MCGSAPVQWLRAGHAEVDASSASVHVNALFKVIVVHFCQRPQHRTLFAVSGLVKDAEELKKLAENFHAW